MASQGFLQSIISAAQAGEVWLFPIAACFAFTLGFTIERVMRLFFEYSVDGNSLMFEIRKFILSNDIDGAIRHCNGAGKAAVAQVLKSGLQRASRPENQIQNAIDATSLEVIPKLERRLPYLALIANLSTLFGLLGTISGLIESFASLTIGDPANRQAQLGAGIAKAMSATAFGLTTAIFAMIVHGILVTKATKITEEIDEFGVKLLDLLTAHKYRGGGGSEGQN